MLTLRRMSQAEFEVYWTTAVPSLAQSLGRARDLAAPEALSLAQRSFQGLFPEKRVDSPDQFLFRVLHGEEGVGTLHFGILRDRPQPYAYVWDIVIEPKQRGKGYGEKTMNALESEVRSLGLSRIGLNVFGYNTPALRLYEKLGYRAASVAMVKELSV